MESLNARKAAVDGSSLWSSSPHSLTSFNYLTAMPRLVKINDQLAVPMPGFGGMVRRRSPPSLVLPDLNASSSIFRDSPNRTARQTMRRARSFFDMPSTSCVFTPAFHLCSDIKLIVPSLPLHPQGCTFWNTATIYGPEQHNEKLIGQVLREGDNRSKVFITTKWGLEFEDGKLVANGSPAFAEHCLEQSLQNLGSYPDAWLLHRVDKKTPIEESVAAMEAARKAGKCQFIGLSAMSASTLRRATKVATIDFVEMDFSPFETSTMEVRSSPRFPLLFGMKIAHSTLFHICRKPASSKRARSSALGCLPILLSVKAF